jgi:hypothetical protein
MDRYNRGMGGGPAYGKSHLAPDAPKGSFDRLAAEQRAGWENDKATILERYRQATNPEYAANPSGSLLAPGETLDDLANAFTLGSGQTKQSGLGAVLPAFDQRQGIRAYHGSPYDFDKFDLSKIGTGEGAQAYGHGLYFAENEATAQSYKNILGGREFSIGDKKLVSSSGGASRALDQQSRGQTIAADALDDAFNAQSSAPAQFAANKLRYQQRLYPEESKHIEEALKTIGDWQESGGTQKLQGRMYEVNVNAEPDQFLDWDKPLSQQPQQPLLLNAMRERGLPLVRVKPVFLDESGRRWRVAKPLLILMLIGLVALPVAFVVSALATPDLISKPNLKSSLAAVPTLPEPRFKKLRRADSKRAVH